MTFPIGSVSTGTLRPEDLLPAFVDALRDIVRHTGDQLSPPEVSTLAEADAFNFADQDAEDDDPEAIDWLLDELTDAINSRCPPYIYFGAHEGDGADFGFWPSFDSLEDDCRSGEVLKVSDLSEIPEGHSGTVAHVSDHGNVTLYQADSGKLTELWSCV